MGLLRIPVDPCQLIIDNSGFLDLAFRDLFLVTVVLCLAVVPDTVLRHVCPAACLFYPGGLVH
jgi:hypothetical protein